MDFTIEIGWWAVPVFITIMAFTVAGFKFIPAGTYGAGSIWNAILVLLASVASLIAWLIYALAT